MQFKNAVTGLASLLLVAFLATGCEDSTPTEPQADGTPSLTAAPKKATTVAAVVDLTGPIPGFPNVINLECVTIDTETGTAHFKNCIVLGSVTGDLEGSVEGELNGWQNMAVGSRIYGFGHLDVCYDGLGCGAFDGPMKGDGPPGGHVEARLNGHGTGDFHTLQIRYTIVERGNTEIFDLEGIIF
jgi:hypothetical protein